MLGLFQIIEVDSAFVVQVGAGCFLIVDAVGYVASDFVGFVTGGFAGTEPADVERRVFGYTIDFFELTVVESLTGSFAVVSFCVATGGEKAKDNGHCQNYGYSAQIPLLHLTEPFREKLFSQIV